jgi:hypothetical protein
VAHPLGPAQRIKFVGARKIIGGQFSRFTVTVKRQLLLFPQLSLTIHCTFEVPNPK